MKKRIFLFAMLMIVVLAGASHAQDDKLGATVGGTYLSKYLLYGIDVYGDNHSAFLGTLDLDLYGTGFHVGIDGYLPNQSGFENVKELNYSLSYSRSVVNDSAFDFDYTVNYKYYDLYDGDSKLNDFQELGLMLEWPNLCSFGAVPHYRIVKLWPVSSDNATAYRNSGFVHAFGFTYALKCEKTEQVVNLGADIVYNDGFAGTDSDWTHAVLGLSTPIKVGEATVTPAAYYQVTMDESVNSDDELYFGVNVSYSF